MSAETIGGAWLWRNISAPRNRAMSNVCAMRARKEGPEIYNLLCGSMAAPENDKPARRLNDMVTGYRRLIKERINIFSLRIASGGILQWPSFQGQRGQVWGTCTYS